MLENCVVELKYLIVFATKTRDLSINLHRTVGLQNAWMNFLLCWLIAVLDTVNNIFDWNTFSTAGNNVRN